MGKVKLPSWAITGENDQIKKKKVNLPLWAKEYTPTKRAEIKYTNVNSNGQRAEDVGSYTPPTTNNLTPLSDTTTTTQPQNKSAWSKWVSQYNNQLNEIGNGNAPKALKNIGTGLGFVLDYLPHNVGLLKPFQRAVNTASETMVGKGNLIDYKGNKIADVNKNLGTNKVVDTIADMGGNLLGNALMPVNTSGTSNLLNMSDDISQMAANKLTRGIGNNALRGYTNVALRGGIDNGIGNIVDSIRFGQNAKDTAQNGLQGALGGAAFFMGGKALNQGLNALPKWANKLNAPTNDLKPLQSDLNNLNNNSKGSNLNPLKTDLNGAKSLNLVPSSKKYTIGNKPLSNTLNEYDNAVKDIQNMYGHYKLTPEEIQTGADKLGIDLNGIVGRMKQVEGLKPIDIINNAAESGNLRRVALGEDLPKITKANNLNPLETPIKTQKLNNLDPPLKNSVEISQVENNLKSPLQKITGNTPVLDQNGILRPEQKIVDGTKKEPFSFKKAYNKFYSSVIDSNNSLKPINEDTYRLATNSKSTSGIVDNIFKGNLADKEGNKVGDSLEKVIKDNVPQGKDKDFWEYVLQRNNIDRAAQGKPVYPQFDSKGSSEVVKQWENLNPEWKGKADNIINWIDTFQKTWGVDTGIINKDLYGNLRKTYKSYVPTQRDFSLLEDGINSTSGKGFVNQKTPIKKATGSERDIVNPVENIMNMVNRTVRTAKSNEIGQSLLDTVKSDPVKMKQFAEIMPDNTPQSLLPVNNVVSVLVDGKPVNLKINNKELLETLKGIYSNPNLNEIDKAARKVTNVFKGLITQNNPLFAISNIARDLPTAYVYGTENNPLKFVKNLGGAVKDIATNSENYQRYKAVGGGGGNFFNSNDVTESVKKLAGDENVLQKSLGLIEKFNNITESAPRLAEFNKIFSETGDVQKALYAANDITTNFSRGGNVAKKADIYVPYLNAGIQGLDKMKRQFQNKPIPTVAKGLVGITSLTVGLDYLNKDNENYKALDNRTKDNYYCIPNGDTFIKIPKSRELGVIFGSLFERSIRQNNGEKNAFKGFGNNAMTNFAPSNPVENNILSPLISNLPRNKDFANRTIVPNYMTAEYGDNRSPKYQYDEKTSEIAKALGDVTNLSPKQIDYVIKSYTGVIGQLLLPGTVKSTSTGNLGQDLLKPIKQKFTADSTYSNQSVTDFYDNMDKLSRTKADFNINETAKPEGYTDKAWANMKPVPKEDSLIKLYTKATSVMSSLRKNKGKGLTTLLDKAGIQKQINEIAKNTNKLYNNPDERKIQEYIFELDRLSKGYQ